MYAEQLHSNEIITKAKEFGADLAGIAKVADLKQSPSHYIIERIPQGDAAAVKELAGVGRRVVKWPEGAKSAIVISVSHPRQKPELDWWILGGESTFGNTAGNKILISIMANIAAWLEKDKGVCCFKVPYQIELGGIFMKDAAVLAGLGCIGLNNLLITPRFGPRQRLKVLLIDKDLPSTGPTDFAPCLDCHIPCRKACPEDAFADVVYSREDYTIKELPGRTGAYNRLPCGRRMDRQAEEYEAVTLERYEKPGKLVRFCRECELACPVGND